MNTKPIPFSTAMVRALLAGRKTQTRRAMKPQPDLTPELNDDAEAEFYAGDECVHIRPCPYGKPGDLLWVRSPWRTHADLDPYPPRDLMLLDGLSIYYEGITTSVGVDWGRYRHARFMPRAFSLLTLQLTDVRVQRLQDISEVDARAEGLERRLDWLPQYRGAPGLPWRSEFPREAFSDLWQSINGPESWDVNPWVWALSFRVIHANVDAVLADPAAHGAEVRNVA